MPIDINAWKDKLDEFKKGCSQDNEDDRIACVEATIILHLAAAYCKSHDRERFPLRLLGDSDFIKEFIGTNNHELFPFSRSDIRDNTKFEDGLDLLTKHNLHISPAYFEIRLLNIPLELRELIYTSISDSKGASNLKAAMEWESLEEKLFDHLRLKMKANNQNSVPSMVSVMRDTKSPAFGSNPSVNVKPVIPPAPPNYFYCDYSMPNTQLDFVTQKPFSK